MSTSQEAHGGVLVLTLQLGAQCLVVGYMRMHVDSLTFQDKLCVHHVVHERLLPHHGLHGECIELVLLQGRLCGPGQRLQSMPVRPLVSGKHPRCMQGLPR